MSGFQPEFVDSATGARLCLRVMEAEGPARGIVMIHHGLAEHGGRYERFARYLASRGYHACAHDHRGHGQTSAPDAPPRVYALKDGWMKVMGDARFVREHMMARFPGLPLIVFGHSMGGVIAMNQAMDEHQHLAGVAVWNANLALGGLAGLMRALLWIEGLFRKPAGPSLWLNALTFEAWGKQVKKARTDCDWLSRIPEEVDAYIADPLCGWPASRLLWRDFVNGFERGEDGARLENMARDLPIHLAGGGADPATNNGKAVKILAGRLYNNRFTRVTLRHDPKARHETLNEIGYEQAMSDLADWADRIIAEGRVPQ
ncbi:MAG: alpha/beta fold hydrolase [Caulobacterales bacterium]|uniref:alpha/beta fold hydrolase n=1 Tax=Glycocaulis sp. TaxID=1969725 RepID=UPI003F9EE021